MVSSTHFHGSELGENPFVTIATGLYDLSIMVLYRVYSEPHLRTFHSTVCSKATLFQIIVYSLIIIPPFFIAYATNGRLF